MANQNVISMDMEKSPLDRVPGLRQLVLLVVIAAAVAVGVWAVLWMEEEPYSILFSRLPDGDAAEIVQALDAAAIPNRYRAGAGTIMVPSDQVHTARLQLASLELPVSGDVGFEMFAESNGLSDSQFIESARYQRALEVELQRTISSIRAIRTARVHLAVPRPTVFVRDREPAGASVLLNLHPGRRLEPAQVESIVNLVASSVPEMEAAQVTVVDSTGDLLSDRGSSEDQDSLSQIERLTQRIEVRYRERIESLLTPLVGRGRVRAQVAVRLSPELLEETREVFDDENQIVRSEQISEQTGGFTAARGIPGALSNQPPITPQDAQAGQGDDEQDAAGTPPNERPMQTEALRNFEIGRTIQHIQQPSGEIRRISAAVIVDEKEVATADGEVESVPYSAEEIERMSELVRQAIGFDAARNDSVSVFSAAFQESGEMEQVEPEAPSLIDRLDLPGILRIAAITVVLLLLILSVIRPTLRQLVMTLPPRTMALPPAVAQSLPGGGNTGGDDSAESRGEPAKNRSNPYAEKVSAAKGIVKEDPKRVAQVVKQWVNEDGG